VHLLQTCATGFLVPQESKTTTTTIFHEALRAARILQKDVDSAVVPPTLVFVGRSGTHIEATLRYLYEKEGRPSPRIVSMAFSAAPGLIDSRTQSNPGVYKIDLKKEKPEEIPFKNVLVPKRVQVLYRYWDSLELSKIPGPIWTIDYINSGGNLYSFLELSEGYFRERHKPFPLFRFYGMNLSSGGALGVGHFWIYVPEHRTLKFDSYLEEWGIRPIQLQAYPLDISFEAYTVMNFDDFHALYTAVPRYQAWNWKRLKDDKGQPVPGAVDPKIPGRFHTAFKNNFVVPAVDWILEHPETIEKGMNKDNQRDLWIKILKEGGTPDSDLEGILGQFSKITLAAFKC
jgi:hypothetical protein